MEVLWFLGGTVGAVGKVFLLLLGHGEVFWFVMGLVVGGIVAEQVSCRSEGL